MAPPVPRPLHSQKVNLTFKNVPGLTVCGMRYAPKHRPAYPGALILEDKWHTLYSIVHERHRTRDRNTLWCYISANTMNTKKILRSKCERRIKESLYEAMRERGIRPDGKSLSEGLPYIRGSLDIFPLEPIIFAKQEEVKRQMHLIVDSLLHSRKSQPGDKM